MKEWLATKDVAELLGINHRTVQLKARREGWRSRKRSGRGGGYEYHIDHLPARARAELTRHHAGAEDARKARLANETERSFALRNIESGLRDVQGLSAAEQHRLNARLAIVRRWQSFYQAGNRKQVASEYKFAELYNAGEIEIDAETRAAYPTISRPSLTRWRRELKQHGVTRLAGRYGNRKGQSLIASQPELLEYLQAAVVHYPHITARNLYQGMRARFSGREDIRLPKQRSVDRWLINWKKENDQVFTAIANPDRWKNNFMVAHGSLSEGIERLNQVWEFDATPADVMLLDGRHSLSGIIDVYSRRAKLLVTPTNKATAVAALIRRGLMEWGVPETARIDNGKEYVGHHLNRVFASLNIELEICPPFQPWHKPHIERFFETFSHGLVELLPGYIGHNVADRKELEARQSFADRLTRKNEVIEVKMTSDEFQQFCDRWVESLYHHQERADLGGQSPFDIAANWTGEIRRVRDERALDLLLTEAPDNHGRRTVHKKGIRIKWPHQSQHHWYIAPELGEYVRQAVTVLYDPAGDMGRVYVFNDTGFICIAECPELTGIDRREYAMAAKRRQRESVQTRRRQLKAASKDAAVGMIAEEILADAEQQHGNVRMFPRAGEEHTTEFLKDAAEAVQASDNNAPRPLDKESLAAHEALLHPTAPEKKTWRDMTPPERDRYWLALDARVREGEKLNTAEQAIWEGYQQSEDFRSFRLLDDFGSEAAG